MKISTIIVAGMLCLVLGGCSRHDYYTAVDNQGRFLAERRAQIIAARLEMFNKAMEVAGKTDTPLDDLLVYITYDKETAGDGVKNSAVKIDPPAEVPEYIRSVGNFVVPFIPWYYAGKMVSAGYDAMRQALGPRYVTGGGPLNIYDSYNNMALNAGRDGSLTGPSRVLTDSHDMAADSEPEGGATK